MTKESKVMGRPPGAKNVKGLGDRVAITFTVSRECVDFLDKMRGLGHIKGRLIENALREVHKF